MMKKLLTILIIAALMLSVCACGATSRAGDVSLRPFVDSAGREVMVPITIDRIAPSGTNAQLILYTLCPEKLIGLSQPFSRVQKRYINEACHDLSIFGQFYGGSGTMNYEEIISAAPDIIIDIGEEKTNIAADMDELQERTGIPVIFIEASLDTFARAYDMLGDVLGISERAAELSGFVREAMALAENNRTIIGGDNKIRAVYSQGEYGLEVNGRGSIHACVFDAVGIDNIAVLGVLSSKGGDEVSIDQMLLWQPELVILAPGANYNEIFDDPIWANVTAVKNGNVFEAPLGPYNWMGRPPAIQCVLGVLWLGNLIYPELYDYDMAEKAQEFYALFFGYELTDTEAWELMKNSTYR